MFLFHFICNVNCLACPDPHFEPIDFLKNTLTNGRGIIDDVADGLKFFLLRRENRSGFKAFNWVQGQGGWNVLTAGIYIIFRGLKHSAQRGDWAQGEVLNPLLA